jgi:hypothetical protein
MAKVKANQATLQGQQKKGRNRKGRERRERSAGRIHESIGANYFVS